jgi:hypothetical protein
VFQPRPDHLRDRRRSRPYAKHGLTALQRAVERLGAGVVDTRTPVGQALAAWRTDLIADLGGPDVVSTQQLAILDLAVRTKLLLDSIDAWLLRQPSLVNHRRRALLPVVLQRQSLANALANYMSLLGLARRPAKTVSLMEYLATGRDDAAPADKPVAPSDES